MDADVTDSAGTPAEPDGNAGDERASDPPAADTPAPRAGRASTPPPAAADGENSPSDETVRADGTHEDVTDESGTPAGNRGESADDAGAPDGSGDERTDNSADGPTDGSADGSTEDAGNGPADDPAHATADKHSTGEHSPDRPAEAETGDDETEAAAHESADATAEPTQNTRTTHAGTDAGVEPKVAVAEAADEADPAAPEAGPDAPARKRHWLRWVALGTAVFVVAASGVGWWFYQKLDGNITTDTSAAAELETYEKERPTPVALNAQNILLLGSDTRSGKGNSKYGQDGGTQRSDTTILLHIAADRQSATAMSVPRDLMVSIPSCRKPDGTRTREQFAQFNWAFEFGGAACTIRTVERMTGIRVDHHMVVDFSGFKEMVDAVDGVEVCLKEPIDDADAHLKLPAGKQTLNGEQALGYVRARKSIGNGSDTERMDRQQQFLGALVKKVQSNGVLLNPARLYPVLDAATKSLTTDPGLDSLRDLYDLTRSVRSIPTEKVQFLTVPRQAYSADPNRDELRQPDAAELFKRLRQDSPITVVPGGIGQKQPGEKPDPNSSTDPSPSPTFAGRNAASAACE
ncbi:LCP family protein [Streptomyces sp. AM8-1-1]|uniref:LCP family protein n=1 Tax=Streptomyces sp. AM8-1-1 TaxID=3075825 RepID=UPI0028C3E981|nr:LCP family protein [Streptomyces sp. AM8-1-1]WNO74213.1 LCP family protein [Streptomyces sp. AM8-1-1]